jgi:hypothetical protein
LTRKLNWSLSLRGGQSDPAQLFEVFHLVLVVAIDQPLVGRVGLGQLAGGAQSLGLHPVGQGRVGIELQCRVGRLLGGGVVATRQRQPGQLGGQGGGIGVLRRGRLDRFGGFFALA